MRPHVAQASLEISVSENYLEPFLFLLSLPPKCRHYSLSRHAQLSCLQIMVSWHHFLLPSVIPVSLSYPEALEGPWRKGHLEASMVWLQLQKAYRVYYLSFSPNTLRGKC